MGRKPDSGGQTTTTTATDVLSVKLPPAKGFGRGYDPHEVERVIAQYASTVEVLNTELEATRSNLAAARTELLALRAQVDREGSASVADHAVNVLNTAQQTADAILRQAHEELESVRDAADRQLERAREAAADIRRGSERAARQLTNEAARRTAMLEQQAAARLERLTIKSELAQHEIDREAGDLQALRDAGRSQLVDAIDSVLERLTDQYGRAHPLAAQAAAARRMTGAPAAVARLGAGARNRRPPKLAGRPTGVADPVITSLLRQSTVSPERRS